MSDPVVVRFPGHHWARSPGVPLTYCTVCGGWGRDGSLPTHCPGREMTEGEVRLVEEGAADFLSGKWVPVEPVPRAG